MYATDFEFDGKRLSDFGCILVSFSGTQDGAVSSGADIVFSSAQSLTSERWDLFGSRYDNPYSTSFTIIKNPCNEDSNFYLTPLEVATLQRWLCRRTKYCKFKILAEGYEDIYWNGWFSSQQHISGSNIIGLDLVFTADAPYAYLDDIQLHFTASANTSFKVNSVSFEEGYIIPDMKITIKGSGLFSLQNNRDTKTMQIANCINGEVITISGKYLDITSSNTTHNANLPLDFNFIFPRLFNTYDDTINTFTPSLACDIDISYAPAFKVGI